MEELKKAKKSKMAEIKQHLQAIRDVSGSISTYVGEDDEGAENGGEAHDEDYTEDTGASHGGDEGTPDKNDPAEWWMCDECGDGIPGGQWR